VVGGKKHGLLSLRFRPWAARSFLPAGPPAAAGAGSMVILEERRVRLPLRHGGWLLPLTAVLLRLHGFTTSDLETIPRLLIFFGPRRRMLLLSVLVRRRQSSVSLLLAVLLCSFILRRRALVCGDRRRPARSSFLGR